MAYFKFGIRGLFKGLGICQIGSGARIVGVYDGNMIVAYMLQWVQYSNILYASPPYSNFTNRKYLKIPEVDTHEARKVLTSVIAVYQEGGIGPSSAPHGEGFS
jgi:hypothetical protein